MSKAKFILAVCEKIKTRKKIKYVDCMAEQREQQLQLKSTDDVFIFNILLNLTKNIKKNINSLKLCIELVVAGFIHSFIFVWLFCSLRFEGLFARTENTKRKKNCVLVAF